MVEDIKDLLIHLTMEVIDAQEKMIGMVVHVIHNHVVLLTMEKLEDAVMVRVHGIVAMKENQNGLFGELFVGLAVTNFRR